MNGEVEIMNRGGGVNYREREVNTLKGVQSNGRMSEKVVRNHIYLPKITHDMYKVCIYVNT